MHCFVHACIFSSRQRRDNFFTKNYADARSCKYNCSIGNAYAGDNFFGSRGYFFVECIGFSFGLLTQHYCHIPPFWSLTAILICFCRPVGMTLFRVIACCVVVSWIRSCTHFVLLLLLNRLIWTILVFICLRQHIWLGLHFGLFPLLMTFASCWIDWSAL